MTGRHHRWLMLSRIAAAFVGGYTVSSLLTAVLARTLPLPAVDAVLVATMSSFFVYAAIIIVVFHSRTVTRAGIWLAAVVAPLVLLLIILPPGARP